MNDFRITLNDCLKDFDFNQVEVGTLHTPLTISFYEKWLQEKNFGSMQYLQQHLDFKKNPRLLHPDLNSVISISQAYFPAPMPIDNPVSARVALYAQNKDYHHWLTEKLQRSIQELQKVYPNEVFLPYVDSGPVLERNWAYENRMGWFGKNTCLIHPQFGSLFFIAEILTSVKVEDPISEFEPLPDFCGDCRRCIEVCPTSALVKPRVMKADLCISYLTIEAKEAPPLELRKKMQDWFFGCDLCQTVCPWNEKFFRQKKLPRTHFTSTAPQLKLSELEKSELIAYFRWLLTASHNQIQKKNQGLPFARAGAKGLKRNALVVIANRGLTELRSEVENLQIPEFEELKEWTLSQLNQ